jgi:hypothetical protein
MTDRTSPETETAASLTERLIQAAVDYERSEGIYSRGCKQELSEARAAVESAILDHAQAPLTHRWRAPGAQTWIYDPEPEWLEDHKFEVEWEPVYGAPQRPGVAPRWQVTDEMVHAGAIGIVQDVSDHDGGLSFHELSEQSKQEALTVSRACLTSALADTSTDREGKK